MVLLRIQRSIYRTTCKKSLQKSRKEDSCRKNARENSGVEHHPEPNHPQPTDEATVAVLTPNRFGRMITDPGFPSPASNPAPFVVTTEAFLGLISQVQALAGMVQTIVPYLP
ncbi:hypothetical protein B296_00056230 [Ensete ventricosum]|uniref:Uncharacterized protein n=1 Tax=Ensete ventricosum TaxID=4639 RepID=A0A426XWL0_ENSVE|nr:hypothetical protein B296_00056230 [Ensete ventricosum]